MGGSLRCRCPELARLLCAGQGRSWGALTSAWAKADSISARDWEGYPSTDGTGRAEPVFPLGFQFRRGISCLCSVVFSGFVFLVWGDLGQSRASPAGSLPLAGLSPSNHSGDLPSLTVCRPVRPCSPWRHSKEELQGIDLRGTSVGTPASEHPTGEAQGTQGPRHLAVALPAEVGFWPMWVCEG